MFEEFIAKIKDIYYTLYAKRYVHKLEKRKDETAVSNEVVPEEVKYKILKQAMIDDKETIYSIMANLTSVEHKEEMIKKYIKIEEMQLDQILQIPENLRIICLRNKLNTNTYPAETIEAILNNTTKYNMPELLNSNLKSIYSTEMIARYVYEKFHNQEEFGKIINFDRLTSFLDENVFKRDNIVLNFEDLINDSNKVKALLEFPRMM